VPPTTFSTSTIPTSPASVVTNFRIFKEATYFNGSVISGWNFSSSDQGGPTAQYCYFRAQDGAGTAKVQNLASDGKLIDTARSYTNIDASDAASRCVWYNGKPTRSY
jgi:hypothetical protein